MLFLRICCRMRVYGRENLPRRGGYILASNHTSFLDPVILGVVAPRPLNFMAKNELFRIFILGRLVSMVGAFPVMREKADIGAVREAIRRLKEGKVLLLFPEGTRTDAEILRQGLPGGGMLAVKADVPIIPVLIIGAERALPKKARFVRFRPIRVYFLEKIVPAGKSKKDYGVLTGVVMEKIAEARRRYGD